MRIFFALLLGKAIYFLTRILKTGGGSAAPGYYGLKIDPEIVTKLSPKIKTNIIVTGTNGKTTTSRMVAHFASKNGLSIIRNATGSNLERGIASALISKASLLGKVEADLGIWEVDEAVFNQVALKLNAKVLVFLNLFRDQLDRYGEIDSVLKGWEKTLAKIDNKAILIVNGDDKNTAALAKSFSGKIFKFGVRDFKIDGESLVHKKEVENLDFEAKNLKLIGLEGSKFSVTGVEHVSIELPIPGVYHVYDFLAAFATGVNLNIPASLMAQYLGEFKPAFGRVERLPFGYIFLIKNPAGATQVFETIAPNIKSGDRLLLALNDNFADGTDVSWIWDANFEVLQNSSRVKSRDFNIYVSGERAYDLAVRLKYAGFNPAKIEINPSLKQALESARTGLKGHLYILPTYTAMLELQKILTEEGTKKHYWRENE